MAILISPETINILIYTSYHNYTLLYVLIFINFFIKNFDRLSQKYNI